MLSANADEIIRMCKNSDNVIRTRDINNLFKERGIRTTDERLSSLLKGMRKIQVIKDGLPTITDLGALSKLFEENIVILSQIFKNDMAIPNFNEFCKTIDGIYHNCKNNNSGTVASYIPQLARYSPDLWGVSICTVDGQRYSIGNVNIPFTMQSCSKPFTYGLCLNELGSELVHRYVGHEPSGRNFNEICLDSSNKPHNPMLNSGAMMTSAIVSTLIEPSMKNSEKFDYVLQYMKKFAGGEFLGFNNAVFMSERETADRNMAMAYYMKENRCFPPKTRLLDIMDLYFQTCSMEVTTESLSVMGASLANGGICPPTAERVLTSESVRDIMSLMFSCGMYNYSGEFAFSVGLPAKSGVSGCMVIVIPNVMGIGLWSPPLDEKGNSERGLQFCEELVAKYNFHRFDNLKHAEKKSDPRLPMYEQKGRKIVTLLFAASKGDLLTIKNMFLQGQNLNECDYDGRTALHVAAAEGHLDCVRFLVETAQVNCDCHDRWGFTPMDEASRFGHTEVLKLLE